MPNHALFDFVVVGFFKEEKQTQPTSVENSTPSSPRKSQTYYHHKTSQNFTFSLLSIAYI